MSSASGHVERAHHGVVSGLPSPVDDNGEIQDEHYPLLRRAHRGVLSVTGRALLLLMMFIILFGGIIVGIWLIIDSEGHNCGNVNLTIVERSGWDARPPVINGTVPLPVFPAEYVIVIHTATKQCSSRPACEKAVRKDQDFFMDDKHYTDIGYNFLVGGDGRVYEGRGFRTQGAFVAGYNNRSLGLAFIGNFEEDAPPCDQLDVAQMFLRYAVKNKQLAANYKLIGHKQVANTDSPGQVLYDIIQSWHNWENCYRTC